MQRAPQEAKSQVKGKGALLHLSEANAALGLALLSLLTLGIALFTEIVWGWEPCTLCSLQRLPYLSAPILLGAASGFWTRDRRVSGLLLWLSAASFTFGLGAAFYHVGAEEGWWRAAVACASAIDLGQDADAAALLAILQARDPVSCEAATPFFFGLSMALSNLLASLGFLAATLALLWRYYRTSVTVKTQGENPDLRQQQSAN